MWRSKVSYLAHDFASLRDGRRLARVSSDLHRCVVRCHARVTLDIYRPPISPQIGSGGSMFFGRRHAHIAFLYSSAAIALALPTAALAGDLAGSIVDATGTRALQVAEVEVVELGSVDHAGMDGRFRFVDISDRPNRQGMVVGQRVSVTV